jgi:hypothetical protein
MINNENNLYSWLFVLWVDSNLPCSQELKHSSLLQTAHVLKLRTLGLLLLLLLLGGKSSILIQDLTCQTCLNN